ncbi:Spb1 C-terminal domain-domain-containing protein [Catenaria anguillulae PL171]|uniref:Spb1 C-terminal domain-domain-containing protein n=1 Tax=Catenaria anguillulae PL171 TaxID=765915 RepID=A0A1Y2I0E7_9FUNG|nr:Spb1 C-terminal domain-domain-containing protein [Catenaria anguillulae PL171]
MGKKGKTGKGRLDKFYHLAKEQGYRSRAAFKLIQINKKYNFLEKAKVLIDLCAAPGGWLQVASKCMPSQAIIVGVDLVPIKPIPRCITFAEDITTDKCRAALRGAIKTWKADVVLHDGAPNVGTAWVQDAYSQSELVLHSLKLATEFLNKGGWFVTKVFRSKDYNNLMWVFNQLFDSVEATKPPSSRNVSAEIFVVCQGFKAPKKLDPKFLDPRHVFKELEDQAVTSLTSVFMPEKKKRHRDGYGDNERILFHTTSAYDFLMAEDPVGVLAANHQLTFATPDDLALKSHPETTDELLQCCTDLKVLGKKDFKAMLKWRTAIRIERGLEKPKGVVEKKEGADDDDEANMDDEERMARELERAMKEEATKEKRAKRKLNEKRAKEVMRLQMNMTTPTELATEDLGDDSLFRANEKSKALVSKKAAAAAAGAELDVVMGEGGDEVDEALAEAKRKRREDFARAGIVLSDDDVDMAEEADVPQLSGRAALFYASNPMLQSLLQSTMSGATTNADDEDKEDYLNQLNDDLEAETLSRKRKRGQKEIPTTLADSKTKKETKREAAKAKRAAIHAVDVEGLTAPLPGVVADEDDPNYDPQAQEAARTKYLAASDSESDSDDDDDESADEGAGFDSDGDAIMDDVELDTTGPPPNALTTPHALALAHMVHQNKHAMVDASFNRYTYGDDDELPAWFKDDERKFNKPVMPISKETVEAIEARRRALDARPIKKVAEAKYRKKKRAMAKVERQMKRAAAIADSEDMTEAAKARAITKIVAKKIAKVDEKPKVVVARGSNRGVKGRPTGVKGRYKMVDPRMRKELRAQKKVAAASKNKRRKTG